MLAPAVDEEVRRTEECVGDELVLGDGLDGCVDSNLRPVSLQQVCDLITGSVGGVTVRDCNGPRIVLLVVGDQRLGANDVLVDLEAVVLEVPLLTW